MKCIEKGNEPIELTNYLLNEPTASWRDFTAVYVRKRLVQQQIKADQGGLCAYCEIDLLEGTGQASSDFRVEHFHPKSDRSTAHNWHLDWQNLLGCCHGGSCKSVADSALRFDPSDASCDVPKGEKNLTGVILNPLTLPAFPSIFKCERSSGKLSVCVEACQNNGISVNMAQATIDELNLNARRLNHMRQAVLNKLNSDMQQLVKQGKNIGDAQQWLSQVYLSKNAQMNWPAFFTTIRGFLGSSAEAQLNAIGYTG